MIPIFESLFYRLLRYVECHFQIKFGPDWRLFLDREWIERRDYKHFYYFDGQCHVRYDGAVLPAMS